jgi:hypothetical protein
MGKALPDICCSATFKAVNTLDKNFTRNNRAQLEEVVVKCPS